MPCLKHDEKHIASSVAAIRRASFPIARRRFRCGWFVRSSALQFGRRRDRRSCESDSSITSVDGVVIDVFAKFFEHLDGGADLSGGWCLHNQTWMPCDGLCASSCRCPGRRLESHCARLNSVARDRMCPRFTESESRGGFLGGEFCGSFNDGAKWITHHAGIFPVGVVNAPQLVARLQSRGRVHGGSSSKSGASNGVSATQ